MTSKTSASCVFVTPVLFFCALFVFMPTLGSDLSCLVHKDSLSWCKDG